MKTNSLALFPSHEARSKNLPVWNVQETGHLLSQIFKNAFGAILRVTIFSMIRFHLVFLLLITLGH